MRKTYIFIIITLLSILSCTKKQIDNKVKMSNFIQFIKVDSIVLDESEDRYIGVINSFSIDDNGFIYCADQNQTQVIIFDQYGKQFAKIGRLGSGPGEITNISSVYVKDGLIYVLSPLKITIYTKSGHFVHDIMLPSDNQSYPLGSEIGVRNTKDIVIAEEKIINTNRNHWLVSVLDFNGKLKEHLGRYDQIVSEDVDLSEKFGWTEISVDSRDNIYIVTEFEPKVQIYSKLNKFVESINMESPLFNRQYKQGQVSQNRTSHCRDIAFLENTNQLVLLYYDSNGKDHQNDNEYLNLYDFNSKTLFCDIKVTEIHLLEIEYGFDGYLYILTDTTPDNVTFSKYKFEIIEK